MIKTLWRWLFTVVDGVLLAAVMSYLFRIRNVRRDWWSVERAAGRVGRWLRGWRVHVRDWLGVTDNAWLRLRDAYRAGQFGIDGT